MIQEDKVSAVKSEKLKKFLLLNITTLVTFILISSFSSVQLTGHIFSFFILGFQSSILRKLKNKLNCRLKLNKDNNWSFLFV